MDGISARAVVAIENEYLPQITYFTAASEGIAAAYVRDYNLPLAQVVLNVFPISNAPAAPTGCGRARPGPSVYWFSQTIGTDRGLECAVRAIAIARSKPHLYLRGNLQAGIKDTLMVLAESIKVADRIHFLAPAPGADMERLASEYDIGFVGEPGHTENRRIALTNKLFSFLLAGLPVVASDIESHREVARVCDAIFIYASESSTELAKAFDNLLLDPRALAKARRKSWQAGQQRYNWDQEQNKVISAAASHIGRPIG
jgi:glycosyltransferase involved in cell wall biosynthesis